MITFYTVTVWFQLLPKTFEKKLCFQVHGAGRKEEGQIEVHVLDLEHRQQPDSGCTLVASVVNLIISGFDIDKLASSKIKRTSTETTLSAMMRAMDLVQFPLVRGKRQHSQPTTREIKVICVCYMPVHYDDKEVVRMETDVVTCGDCLDPFHPNCVKWQDKTKN